MMRSQEKDKAKDIAVLMMAGRGERLFSSIKVKKQFFLLDGKELFLHSLESLCLSKCFHEILLVISKEDEEHVWQSISDDKIVNKRKIRIVHGGETRNKSVENALFSLKKKRGNFNVLIHDAASPFLTVPLNQNIIAKTYRADALTYCLPLADSLFKEDGKGIVYLDRKNLYQVQTPQVFDFRKILAVFEEGYDPECTDEFSKAVSAGLRTLTLLGDLSLFKLTGKEDLQLLRKLSVFVE